VGAFFRQLTLKVPYKVFPDQFGSHVYSARLEVSIALPISHAPRTKRFEAIIDSGATRCMFHADIGRFLGLDIQSGSLERTQGISGRTDSWVHEICIYLPGGPANIRAAFKEGLPVAGLLGMNGFFEHFMVTFLQSARHCEIERIQDQA
jgi:hypothetical protein